MAQPVKRPLDQQDDQLDYLSAYPTSTDIVSDPYGFNCNIFAPTSAVPDNSLYAIPEVSTDNFHPTFQSSRLPSGPLAAYNNTTEPLTTYGGDFKADTASLSNGFPNFGPVTSHFMYLHGNFQSYSPQVPSQSSATMNSSIQPHLNQRHKSRSNTSMDMPSIHGRSVGSEYHIDSPYDGGQGGVMTPGTAQSFEFVEPFPEPDHSSHGLLTHEDDLVGINNREISRFSQRSVNSNCHSSCAASPLGTARDNSRSPQEITLDGIDPSTVAPTFAFNGYNGGYSNHNPDPWVPFALPEPSSSNLDDIWNPSEFFPPSTHGFPLHHNYSPTGRQPNENLNQIERSSNSSEPSLNSASRIQTASLEPINPPPPNDRPNNSRRKAAGRRKGPFGEEKRKSIKSTREARACWCCKMRKVICNPDTAGDCPECLRVWRSKMDGPFLGKPLCIRTPLEHLERIFIPEFMVEQFKSSSVDSLKNDLVQEDGWLDRGKTDIQLLCGFGPPLVVRGVQEFRPNGPVQIFQWRRDNPDYIEAVQTLPLGISQAGFWVEDDVLADFEQHLDGIVHDRDDLNEFAVRVLRSNRYSRSSRTVKAVLEWYQEWRDPEIMSEEAEVLLRSAIKVIMITTIFSRRLILQDIPYQFEKFFNEAPYTSQNYSRHRQCPRLINRQVKAALRVLQQRLLVKVLKDFGRELTQANGWPVCFAVATILAFSLEHIQERSIGFYQKRIAAKSLDYGSAQFSGSEEAIHKYSTVDLVHVFDIIHVIMRCKSEKQAPPNGKRTKKISSIGSSLQKVINDLKEIFEDEENEQIQQTQPGLQVGEEPYRLVSALLELIQ